MGEHNGIQLIPKPDFLDSFVKEIFFIERSDKDAEHSFPFYADGFAGIVYSKSEHPFYQQPKNKMLSNFYLFGQTIKPISLDVKGSFKLLVVKLYPFAVRILLGIDPKKLNDNCYDLRRVEHGNTHDTIEKLNKVEDYNRLVRLIGNYIDKLVKHASINPNYAIKLATNLMLKSKGTVRIQEVCERLSVPERTLQRHFSREIGVTPKQFAKIIQFSESMNQVIDSDYSNLSDIGYDAGYADQSHFIRTFKRYTGKTPKEFQKQLAV